MLDWQEHRAYIPDQRTNGLGLSQEFPWKRGWSPGLGQDGAGRFSLQCGPLSPSSRQRVRPSCKYPHSLLAVRSTSPRSCRRALRAYKSYSGTPKISSFYSRQSSRSSPAKPYWPAMPRYYCDYCDTYLTHDSVISCFLQPTPAATVNFSVTDRTLGTMQPVVRKQHNTGYKHKANVRNYYMQFEEAQTQELIDSKIMEHLAKAGAGPGPGQVWVTW